VQDIKIISAASGELILDGQYKPIHLVTMLSPSLRIHGVRSFVVDVEKVNLSETLNPVQEGSAP
jgi:hypothetical protein